MINPWIISNLEVMAISIIVVALAAGAGMGFFLMIDGWFKNFGWYGKLLYGEVGRDSEFADEFFGKAFLGIGTVNIILPFIVVLSYIYIKDLTWTSFLAEQFGRMGP